MTNKELTRVTYIFVTLFLVLMGYLVYFNVVKSKEVVNSTYNIRQDLLADRVLRGSITDKNGEVLAQTVTNDDGSETREYPEGEVFAHVVGYAAKGTGTWNLLYFSDISDDRRCDKVHSVYRSDTSAGKLRWNLRPQYDHYVCDHSGTVCIKRRRGRRH